MALVPPAPLASRTRALVWGGAGALLLLPAIAMLFTREVRWDAFDFAVAAAILGGVALGVEASHALLRRRGARLIAVATVLTLAALVWIDAAVGLFPGSPLGGS